MTQSTRYAIHQLLVQTLTLAVADAQTEVLDNPKLPIDRMGRKPRVVFLLSRLDKLIEQPGQRGERRSTRQVLGVLLAKEGADAEADALHFACRRIFKTDATREALGALKAPIVREVEIEPELQQIGMDGVLLYSAYEIEYRENYLAP